MAKLVQLYVEGKSDKVFFEGTKFREFINKKGYSVRVKNLRTKGNVLSNFEKFLKIYKDPFANILVYDRDCHDIDKEMIEEKIKHHKNTFLALAVQEIEAWFLADHIEVLKIYGKAKVLPDTQTYTDPKRTLKRLFMDASKGYKNELGFAEHFANKIDFSEAKKHNKSLARFLNLFETDFKA